MLSAITDHCTVTLVEFKTDKSLFVLQEVEIWSATTSDTFVSRNASSELTIAKEASSNIPGSMPDICTGVPFCVAVKVMALICQLVLLPKMLVGAWPFTLTWASARLWAGEVLKMIG